MPISPFVHALGRIDVFELADTPALSRDVALDVDTVHAAWPSFEGAFDSLQGRRMMGLVFGGNSIYRLSSVRLDRDEDNPLELDETTIPGGAYLRLRLRGDAPEIYDQISPAFDALFALADHDASRPHIEYYKPEGEVDCLVPILAVAGGHGCDWHPDAKATMAVGPAGIEPTTSTVESGKFGTKHVAVVSSFADAVAARRSAVGE